MTLYNTSLYINRAYFINNNYLFIPIQYGIRANIDFNLFFFLPLLLTSHSVRYEICLHLRFINLISPFSCSTIDHVNNSSSQPLYHVKDNSNQQCYSKSYPAKCQACGVQGHTVKFCPEFWIVKSFNNTYAPSRLHQLLQQHQTTQPWQPRTHTTMISGSSPWLLDSGASHHMTSDLSNLSTHNPYAGGDDVLIGDGSALQLHTSVPPLHLILNLFSLMMFYMFHHLINILFLYFSYVRLMV